MDHSLSIFLDQPGFSVFWTAVLVEIVQLAVLKWIHRCICYFVTIPTGKLVFRAENCWPSNRTGETHSVRSPTPKRPLCLPSRFLSSKNRCTFRHPQAWPAATSKISGSGYRLDIHCWSLLCRCLHYLAGTGLAACGEKRMKKLDRFKLSGFH